MKQISISSHQARTFAFMLSVAEINKYLATYNEEFKSWCREKEAQDNTAQQPPKDLKVSQNGWS